jgi:diamine N-acetyltransferase
MLRGEHIYLRALEPEDLEFLYHIENNPEFWEVSNTITPYSEFILEKYLKNAHRDIFDVRQLRLTICLDNSKEPIGLIDLYDFEPLHRRAGVGIVIAQDEHRRKGYAAEAIKILKEYAFDSLNLHQLYAGISSENKGSIKLFENAGFKQTGLKLDWLFRKGEFADEFIYQCIRE